MIEHTDVSGKALSAILSSITAYSTANSPGLGEDHYQLITSPLRKSLPLIHASTNLSPKGSVFLDAGCGAGTILTIANSFRHFGKFIGIELDDFCIELIPIFTSLLKNFEIIKEDVLNYNAYKEADVIYVSAPFSHPSFERKLEDKIINVMRKDALFLVTRPTKLMEKDTRVEQPYENLNLYRKK